MDNRPTLTVRPRFLPHLLHCLPGYAFVLLFAGITTHLYYHDAASTLRALLSITAVLCIHVLLSWLQRPTLRFLGAKLYVRCRWSDEQEIMNLRASDFILTQTDADKRHNTGTLRIRDVRITAYAARGGVDSLPGVTDFDQVCAYVKAHFPA